MLKTIARVVVALQGIAALFIAVNLIATVALPLAAHPMFTQGTA